MIGPWMQQDGTTWIRRAENGVPVATVVVEEGDTSGVFAQARSRDRSRSGRFPDLEQARHWCDQVLMAANPVAKVPPRPPVPPPTPQESKKPDAPPVERLLKVLRNDPNLAWEVATKLRVLGPWTPEGEGWWKREDANGFVVATVRGDLLPPPSWRWSIFSPSRADNEVATQPNLATVGEAKASCDMKLTTEWLLVNPLPKES